jgi:hypothetical protein
MTAQCLPYPLPLFFVMFDYSQFRKDVHFESPVFPGKLGLRGVRF